MSVLFVLFILVPIAELFLIIKVGAFLGIFSTLAILILDSFIGAWLVKRQCLSLIR
ncbi:MAG: FxsA family protein, partial [Actinobacteria bacterium]|nr:FxsA family protein [Actinomycetota bacterium]